MVEILLKNGNANTNVVNNHNQTTLMYCVNAPDNLSIMKLLTKYGFDYAKLVNKRENKSGNTVFHLLCERKTDAIGCMKYLFQVCKNIPNCAINILAKNEMNMCGLHKAIFDLNVDVVRYLLENVYFPNNDKSNPNGIAFINMLASTVPLAGLVLAPCAVPEDYNAKRHLKIFKLLAAYGMNVYYKIFQRAVEIQQTEIVCFILQENLCPIYTFGNLLDAFRIRDVCANKEISKALYNYGITHNLIVERVDHVSIIGFSASINLSSFKIILSIVLAHHGINNLKDFNQCSITNVQTLEFIAQYSKTTQAVKLFIEALISGNESNVSQMNESTGIQVPLTCVNNHHINSNTNDTKIVTCKQKCSLCGDNSNGDDSLSGFKCNECKSFICDGCVIVQKISKKIDMIGTEKANLHFPRRGEYEVSILKQVFEYKSNKNMIGKIAKQCPNTIHLLIQIGFLKVWYFFDELFRLLLKAGLDVNSVSSVPNGKKGSIIHYHYISNNAGYLQLLEKHKFNFSKYINFRNSDGRTPFLEFCNCPSHVGTPYFIPKIWKHYARGDCDGFEIDNDGNNGLHLITRSEGNAKSRSDTLAFILEAVFFASNKTKNFKGIAALNQQNKNGNTPLHVALRNDNDNSCDKVKLLLKYECDVAKKYNNEGYLPIHIACKYNNWKGLAALIQNKLYDKNPQDINLSTKHNNEHTSLSLSVELGYSKCVQILCENKHIFIDDMSFYNSIQSDHVEILKCLLKGILNKHVVYDWISFQQSKSITTEFSQQLMQFGNDDENHCVKFLQKLIQDGIKKEDYVSISLLLNYNISSLKLNDFKEVQNITVLVNTHDNSSFDHFDESKADGNIGPWIVKEKLGAGAFGQVKLGINKNNINEKVALKFIAIVNIPTQFVLGEIALVQKIDHSNVIMLKGFNLNVYGNGKTVLIAFEYAPYGELFDLLKYKHYFSVDLSFYCFQQIVSAIVACHGMNIVHRDLKPQNILIGNDFKIKVADFGLSKTLHENKHLKNQKYIVGTPGYMAPELVNNERKHNNYDQKTEYSNESDKSCDIFSLSIILWKMLNGYKSKPFNNCKKNDHVYRFVINKDYNSFWNSDYHKNDNIKFLEKGYNRFNNNQMIQHLFEQMFEYDPSDRITAQKIENDAWFKHMNGHERLMMSSVYDGDLQCLYYENHGIQQNEMKQDVDSIGSLYTYSKEKTQTNNSNNNIVNVGHSDTQPENESSLEISTYSEMMNQLKNENDNRDNNNEKHRSNNDGQIVKLLRKMSDNTISYVRSQQNPKRANN